MQPPFDGSTPAMNIEKLKGLILTSEQYRDQPFAKSEDRTYTYTLDNGSRRLTFFGSQHLYDPSHPMFSEIKGLFEKEKPDMVYIEGWEQINHQKEDVRKMGKETSFEDAAREGESHFTLKLAVDAVADFESPEPHHAAEIAHLLDQGFSHEEVYNFYAYRQIGQFQQQHENSDAESCKEYMSRYLDRFARDSNWSEEELQSYRDKLFAELDLTGDIYSQQTDPIPWDDRPQTRLNDIARASGRFRDEYIFERIVEGLKTHDRIFVVYGSAHAVVQEPALRALFA